MESERYQFFADGKNESSFFMRIMSYDINTWKTKKLKNLVIPFSALYDKSLRQDWLPSPPEIVEENGKRALRIRCGCEQEIIGYAGDENPIAAIHVTEFEMYGEGSGTFWHEVLKQALEKSTGTLEVVRVWEGGDYIDRLRVEDGVISEEEIDL